MVTYTILWSHFIVQYLLIEFILGYILLTAFIKSHQNTTPYYVFQCILVTKTHFD